MSPPLLRLTAISKAFPGVRALRSVDLEVSAGEIHALVGENGAGKSTLIRVITGAHALDEGRLEWEGRSVHLRRPHDAFALGIAAIYQELPLIPALTVRENLHLGRETAPGGILRRASERRSAAAVLDRLGVTLDPDALVRALTIAEQQIVAIARALLAEARLLIMDEPTAALAPREVEALFRILLQVRAEGSAILFISHRLPEVLRIADRITVLRDGASQGTFLRPEIDAERLIELMVGRPLRAAFPARAAAVGEPVLEVEALRGPKVRGVSFRLHRGEVLGLAGLAGSGRTELVRLIFGADRVTGGTIRLDGHARSIRSPRDAIAAGIALLTEDRKAQGLVLGLSARENFALPNLGRWSHRGWIDRARELSRFQHYVQGLRIRIASEDQKAENLSGGNQQKLLVARWIEQDARVLLFDEPTRGIDVGAKAEMLQLLRALAARGKGIVLITSELPELIGASDRVLVLHDGRITGEIRDVAAATQAEVLRMAVL